jgi:hypothetical protein
VAEVITTIIFILRMGSINTCCEPTNDLQLPESYRDPFNNMEFLPTDSIPKINDLIGERLKELSFSSFKFNRDPLPFDPKKHPKAHEFMPMKEKTRGFIYNGQWINQKPDGYGKIYLPSGEFF